MSFTTRESLALLSFALPVFAGSAPGIRNFDRVDARVYRGGQPTEEGFRYLAGLGVKTILDLRGAGSRSKAEERLVKAAGMKYVNVPMTGLTPPTEAETSKILAILEDKSAGPVFVHCRKGADRTGAVIAAYHIDHDGWDNARALNDANGHHMGFLEFARRDYIRNFRPRTAEANAASAGAATVATPAVVVPAVSEARN